MLNNKIPSVTGLVKKNRLWCRNKRFKNKYFTTSAYSKFTNNIFDGKIAAKKLVNESGLKTGLKSVLKIKTLATKDQIKKWATKAEFKAEQDKIVKLQTYDLSLFIGQSYFVIDGAQLYLILQVLYYTLKRLGDTGKVVSWKSKGLSVKKLAIPAINGNSLSPSIKWYEK